MNALTRYEAVIVMLHKEGCSCLEIADGLLKIGFPWGLRADIAGRVRAFLRKEGLLPPSSLPEDKKPWKNRRARLAALNHSDFGDLWLE